MGQVKKAPLVKLIIGFIFKDESFLNRAERILEKRFSNIDFQSDVLSFIHTDYYEKEFGKDLKRKFISFRRLILPQSLPRIKIITNEIERKLSKQGERRVNIDPGYMELSKLVLASTKDYSHRVYLDKGVYAEVTLYYKDRSFKFWEWTYPDYKSTEYIKIFNTIRGIFNEQIKST